jgi:CYTH domain-containing protein
MEEIERKFLVNKSLWEKVEKPLPILISQGYISKSEQGVVRVRTKGEKGFLTIKSANTGISRTEFEYEIPLVDANQLLTQFCEKKIVKKRYLIEFGKHVWEVDEFIEPKQDFVIAEIELTDENEPFFKPDWAEKDVSMEKIYFNSNMI